MAKSHLPIIAKITNHETLGALHINGDTAADGTVGSITSFPKPIRVTRAMLISLRDQLNEYLEKNP